MESIDTPGVVACSETNHGVIERFAYSDTPELC